MNQGKKAVLLYHRVDDTVQDYNRITVNEANFRSQMCVLKEKYKILSLDAFLTYKGVEDVVTITFDDGFSDFYTKALPILEEFQIPATVFITTGEMDSMEEPWTTEILRLFYTNDSECEEICIDLFGRQVYLPLFTVEQRAQAYYSVRQFLMQLSGEEQKQILESLRKQLGMTRDGRTAYQILTAEQCRQLGKHPLVTIGAHTVNHISMGKVENEILEYEVKESIRCLKTVTGEEIFYFAYPFGGKGDYSQHAMEFLQHYGVKAAFTVNNSCYEEKVQGKYDIPRFYVGNWEQSRFENWIEQIWLLEEERHYEVKKERRFYIGRIEDDKLLWNSDEKIIIWGAGIRGKRIKEIIFKAGQEHRVIAFGDNDSELWGQKVDGIEVWPLEKVKKKDAIVVLNNSQDMKIYQQLQETGIKRIHWII